MVFKFPKIGYKIRIIFGHNQFIKWKLLDLEIGIVLSRQKLGIILKNKEFQRLELKLKKVTKHVLLN